MKKRSLILSLAMFFGLPLGLAATASPASAAACYVENSTGGWEVSPNFVEQGSCEEMAHGVWM